MADATSADQFKSVWSLERFREDFEALRTRAWLDTPGCPPAARSVVDVLRAAIDSWHDGSFSWVEWDDTPNVARRHLARLLKVDTGDLALVSSLSEASATVARSLPRGARVLVDSEEFRSNLFPWAAAARRGALDIVHPAPGRPESLTDRLCARLGEDVDLVAVSSVLSSTGVRPNLDEIAVRARSVGAKVFLNLTQSFGVLRLDMATLRPDFVAAHGYKWMLAPRGCAWLYVRPDHVTDVEPLAPGWHTVPAPNTDYFGSGQSWSVQARKLDGGLPWLPWIGGKAAIELLHRLDPAEVESRALSLARDARAGLEDMGIQVEGVDQESHIVRMYASGSDELAGLLRERAVVTSGGPTSLRVGFHGFNNEDDVSRFLDAVGTWKARRTEH